MLNKTFKVDVLAKIKALKVTDTQMLTERVRITAVTVAG